MPHRPPIATPIDTTEVCAYGCGQTARYRFANGKLCCDVTHNKCPKKRQTFSERTDHKDTAAKSLATRIRLGITKSSQIKGAATRRSNGHYDRLKDTMRRHIAHDPWSNDLRCPYLPYKDTPLKYQGSYELDFLQELEDQYGLEWIKLNVSRGPAIWYTDPVENSVRMYLPDFIVDDMIYEIKSGWTWNKKGKDPVREAINRAKLSACVSQGYQVTLIINGERQSYGASEHALDRKIST